MEKMQKSIAVDSEIIGSFISGAFREMQIHTASARETIELLPNRRSLPKKALGCVTSEFTSSGKTPEARLW